LGGRTQKKWIIKNSDGVVRGPYRTEEILSQIQNGELSGEEMISLFPSTDWQPISTDPEFYDKLLEFLEGDRVAPRDGSASAPQRSTTNIDDWQYDQPSHKSASKKTGPVKGSAEKVSVKAPPPPEPPKARNKTEAVDVEPPVIELKKKKKVVRKQRAQKSIIPILVVLSALAAVAYWIMTDTQSSDDRIRLIAPRLNLPANSNTEASTARLKESISIFSADTFTNYMSAQNGLVQSYELDTKNSGAIGFLCLTYYQLWPFAYQDSEDLRAITVATQIAAKIDPASIEASTCRSVDLFIRGRYDEAKSIVETALETHSNSNPVAFYYFKALLLMSNRENESALNYIRSAEQIWPQWLELYQLEGELLVTLARSEEAAKRYRQILAANPRHAEAMLELGILEFRFYRNIEKADSTIKRGLSGADKVSREVASRANLVLAEIALEKGSGGDALKYAQEAYSLNSTNARAKAIILQIGGESKLKNTPIMDRQLVYEGDQLVREGDCSAAQAHYKAAFEVNPKNALAAMKAADCLWKMSLTTEGIDWLNKAIRADPQMIDAYVLLADFYGRRYNFAAAAQILAKANQIMPRNYKVFRGFALMELRRRNAEGAIQSSEKAIQLYEADVESYIINAKALMETKEFSKAFSSASKAIELDINHREAQIVYSEALVGVQGMNAGIQNLNRLVALYPMITDYRIGLGDLYMRDQSFNSAETVFEQVTRIDPKSKDAFLKLGEVRQTLRKYDSALDAYLQAAELDPSDVEAFVKMGQLYLEIRKPAEGQTQFFRAQKINPEYPLINVYIGRAALQNGSPDLAIEEARKEKAKNPNLADPYLLAADAYVELQKYQLCASEYQQAVSLRPQGSEIYIKMARCFRLAGNLDAAVSMINTAAKQESGEPEVWKEQGLIFETRGEAIKAIEAYNQYLVLAPNAADREQVESRIRSLSQ
jgi:tetratricopeptide (TPR) repeat protein